MCHHWRYWSGAYLGGVWSFSFSFYPSEHYFCSTSVATLPQETHWSVGLKEACYGGTDLVRQRDWRVHVLWFPVWSVPLIGLPCWLSRLIHGLKGEEDILSVLGLPGGLFWCGAISFIIGRYQFCHSPSGECLTSWYLFHSCSTFETIRSLSLCRETGMGRLGCCVQML